jgi:hypothetical protein
MVHRIRLSPLGFRAIPLRLPTCHPFIEVDAEPAETDTAHVRHLRLTEPLLIKMNGRKGEGVILKRDMEAQKG